MALVLNSTMSDQFANSYCDADFADDYFAGHYDTSKAAQWAAFSDDQKTLLLISATYDIEQLKFTIPTNLWDARLQYDNLMHRYYYNVPNLPGSFVKYTPLQSLQFPRNADVNYSGVFMPERVKIAECEQAIFKSNVDESAISNALQGITHQSITVGPIQMSERYGTGSGGGADGTLLSPIAKDWLNPFIIKVTGTRLQRA